MKTFNLNVVSFYFIRNYSTAPDVLLYVCLILSYDKMCASVIEYFPTGSSHSDNLVTLPKLFKQN